MSISVSYASQISIVDTVTDVFISPTDPTVTTNGLNASGDLNAASAVPVTKYAGFQLPMVAGVAEINLAALSGLAGSVVVGTGLKVQLVKFRSKITNVAPITIAEGAANGYAMLGVGFTFTLLPGQAAMFELVEAAPDAAAGDRVIDVTGTGTEVLEVVIVLG